MIVELLHRVSGTARYVLLSIIAFGLIYGFGYCSGNRHGSTKQQVQELVARNDSLKVLNDSLAQVVLKQQNDWVNHQTTLSTLVQQREDVKKTVHVTAPGKVSVLVKGEPTVVPVPVPVTDLLASDELTIAEAQKALIASETLIKSLQLQVQLEHKRAESNWQLYQVAQENHGSSHFVLGTIVGALAVLGSFLVFR